MKLNYLEFRKEVIAKFVSYLPKEYEGWRLETQMFPKVNGFLEGFNMIPPQGEGVSPTFYFQELYQFYQECEDINEVLECTAEDYVRGMEYVNSAAKHLSLRGPSSENIIFCLVSGDMNKALLEQVPHRKYLDMAVIYRFLVEMPGNGFNSAIITHDIAEGMNVTEKELYQLALKNTPKLLPHTTECLGEFFVLSNYHRVFGASVILYPEILASAAKFLNSDLLLLPSSIHEIFIIPSAVYDPAPLKAIVQDANQNICENCDILSDNVYVYLKDEDKVIRAELYNKGRISPAAFNPEMIS